MSFNMNEWKKRLPDIPTEKLLEWMGEAARRADSQKGMNDYISDRAFLHTATGSNRSKALQRFTQKYGWNPDTGEETTKGEPANSQESSQEGTRDDPTPEPPTPNEDPDNAEEPSEELYDDIYDPQDPEDEARQEEDPDDEIYEPEDTPPKETPPKAPEPEKKPLSPMPDLPFENPDLGDLYTGEEDDDDDEEPELEKPRALPKRTFKPARDEDDFITHQEPQDQWTQGIAPWKPLLQQLSGDPDFITKLAQTISHEPPPYAQVKPYIIDHPLKNPENVRIRISIAAREGSNRTSIETQTVPLTQAREATRNLVSAGHYQEYVNNYDAILEELENDRERLVSLIHVLESYCENKERSPFEFNIPKAEVSKTVKESMQSIINLLQEQVVKELNLLRGDVKGEFGDVNELVSQHLRNLKLDLSNAVERVMYKVKTDVEQTNLEDIKRWVLYTLNLRGNAYKLGSVPLSIINCMVDDIERRLIQNDFKLEGEETIRYMPEELRSRLSYKTVGPLNKAIPKLQNAKLIKTYRDGTISLSK